MAHISTLPAESPADGGGPERLRLYNSLTRAVEPFAPRRGNLARIYSCGPTVYNYAHIGNMRAYVFADTLHRTLQWKGFDVLHVVNITDVGHLTSDADEGDDKVELAARRAASSVWEVTQKYTRAFFADLSALNARPAAVYCRATQHIQEMIRFVQVLSDRGYTYELEDGVYFDTGKVADYGRLGGLDVAAQMPRARVAANPNKRNASDFSVWRRSMPGQTRLTEWDSPWGRGMPGWHLECSVMSLKYLSGPFDIHTGGIDHRQLHHPNEIAQNQGYLASSETGADHWLHCEFLTMREAKMSKSAGEFWRLQTLLDHGIHPLAYRFFLLQAHYRSPVDFTVDAVAAAQAGYQRILRKVRHLMDRCGTQGCRLVSLAGEAGSTTGGPLDHVRHALEQGIGPGAAQAVREFDAAFSNDLGTPRTMALLAAVFADKDLEPLDVLRVVGVVDLVLGLQLLTTDPQSVTIRPADATLNDEEIEALLSRRAQARAERDFAVADRVRDQLVDAGVVVEDSDVATTWSWRIR